MYRRILLPLDGSDLAERAVPMAEMMAARHDAELHLVHVLEDLPDYSLKMPQDDLAWEDRAAEAVTEYLEAQVRALQERGLERTTATVVDGPVAEALDGYREDHAIDLVVMTTHGEGGFRRWWLGSVADELLRRTPVPLLLQRIRSGHESEERSPEPIRRVLVPLDGSREAEEVLEHARTVASSFGARMTLIQVLAPGLGLGRFRASPEASMREGLTEEARGEAQRYLEEVARELRETENGSVTVDHEVVADEQPADGILERAEEGTDLVALATHGRGGFTRMVLGSVADKVLRGSTTPLLVVQAPAEE